ncbi:MAG: vanadium-dependent haloperoxidase [Deltaproteobacteria bacterium]|nr:vanadium-dependent haloperoxidase [Deltaproteobacteria bacterium]
MTGETNVAEAAAIGPDTPKKRREQAFKIRRDAAKFQRDFPLPDHPDNGDEAFFANKIGSYSKALPHNDLGHVDLPAYSALISALTSGDPNAFEAIPQGGSVKQADPQAAFAFSLEGPDSHHLTMIPPPTFSSQEEAGEMAELYWQALTRDVPFVEYDTDLSTRGAAVDLSKFSIFRGPKLGGVVTTGTLFRGNTPGDLTGPYISQFLWKDIPYGTQTIVQRYCVPVEGNDFMTSYAEWLSIQKGFPPTASITFDSTPRYVSTGRDLAEYLHRDCTYQAFLNTALILLGFGGAALDDANPYKTAAKQGGFITFGGPHILDLVTRVANEALKAAWYQKWLVHRRLRPEAFGGHVHNHKVGAANYPIHPEILNSPVLNAVFSKYGTYLLPTAYPEGCPTHPAYPAGHATIAGACSTVLKAFFKEALAVPNPVVANADGTALDGYSGPVLTIGGELNKLATNSSLGRDTAGVHWRSDGIEGLKLGEAVAIGILTDFRATYNEFFGGFSLTKFDGTTITV